jgi:hypothetical protein
MPTAQLHKCYDEKKKQFDGQMKDCDFGIPEGVPEVVRP